MGERQRGHVLLAVLLLSGLLALLGRQMLQSAWLQRHHAATGARQLLLDSRLLARIRWLETLPIPSHSSTEVTRPWHPQTALGMAWQRCGPWQDSDGAVCPESADRMPHDWHVRLQRLPDSGTWAADAATDAAVFFNAAPQGWQLEIRAHDHRGRTGGWQLHYRQQASP